MRTQRVKSQTLLAITLLLVGGFVLGGTVLPNAIGAPVVDTSKSPELVDVFEDEVVDEDNGTAAVWLSGYHEDPNGNRVGSVSTYVGASLINENDLYCYADASSGLSDQNINAKANAWVKVPDKLKKNHGHGDGDVDIGVDHLIYSISAWDSNTINAHDAPGKAMRASAALKTAGRPRVSVRIDVTWE